MILLIFIGLRPVPLRAQSNSGELRVAVADPTGAGVAATVQIVSEANQVNQTLQTTPQGTLDVPLLPYGVYQLSVRRRGFAPAGRVVEVNTSIPIDVAIPLKLASASGSVTVTAPATLINTAQAGSVNRIAGAALHDRLTALPGRSLRDLIDTQPGWLLEGNDVLHPRGSENQTQYVIDGVPLRESRFPGFAPQIEGADIASVSVYTAGIPAQYGRQLGGVIEVNTLDDAREGFHGQVSLSGGSFATRGGFASGEWTRGGNTLSFSADGSATSHFLNPVVPQNYTNAGTAGDFSLEGERRFNPNNRLRLSLRRALARYAIPNERVQQSAGQLQNELNLETLAIASYEHIFSARALANIHGMWRRTATDYWSNAASTPVALTQHNFFTEAYLNGGFTIDRGPQEWSFGAATDNTFLHESFAYHIADPTRYDPGTPTDFSFRGHHPDYAQSAYAEDLVHRGRWTLNAGLRWDHDHLLLDRQALSPRLSVARYFPALGMTAHLSYDRIFQTPSTGNILLSSSTAVQALAPTFLRLPVQPSLGNYYEGGLSKAIAGEFRLTVNYYRRDFTNYADDDQIQNTTISFPIAFNKAVIYGAEAQLALPSWGRFSGELSYSYMLGNAWYPVTGGLFFGADAAAQASLTGHFPISQDQRNTARGSLRYQIAPRLWVAAGAEFNSGLPFEFDGDYATALAQYGPAVVSRVNFSRGRIYPSTLLSLSAGARLYASEQKSVRLVIDGQNLTNLVDVIDFAGLFSGNAIGPSRSLAARLEVAF